MAQTKDQQTTFGHSDLLTELHGGEVKAILTVLREADFFQGMANLKHTDHFAPYFRGLPPNRFFFAQILYIFCKY